MGVAGALYFLYVIAETPGITYCTFLFAVFIYRIWRIFIGYGVFCIVHNPGFLSDEK